MNKITSIQNELIKEVLALHSKKGREEHGKYMIEGMKLFEEAISSGEIIESVFVSETFPQKNLLEENSSAELKKYIKNLNIYEVSAKIMKNISDTETPQGLAAVIKKKDYDISNIINSDRLLILDRIQDPGNLGTIIRAADAFGISGIVALKGTVDAYNMKVVRSTMGSLFHLPVVYTDEADVLFKKLVDSSFDILVTHLDGKEYINQTKLGDKCAIVIGNEANGVCEDIIKFATKLVKIPMKGKAESLNAAMAATVVMYQMMIRG
jgi:TrmH family RNA methyltransferase